MTQSNNLLVTYVVFKLSVLAFQSYQHFVNTDPEKKKRCILEIENINIGSPLTDPKFQRSKVNVNDKMTLEKEKFNFYHFAI